MPKFMPITSSDPLKEIIKSAFEMDVELTGGWGYEKKMATLRHSSNGLPVEQFEHTFATMRAYIEMNMTRDEETRYGSINPTELSREYVSFENKNFVKVTYEVSGMLEKTYANFINIYKENYGSPDFDMSEHFKQRKEATLVRCVTHWFLERPA